MSKTCRKNCLFIYLICGMEEKTCILYREGTGGFAKGHCFLCMAQLIQRLYRCRETKIDNNNSPAIKQKCLKSSPQLSREKLARNQCWGLYFGRQKALIVFIQLMYCIDVNTCVGCLILAALDQHLMH